MKLIILQIFFLTLTFNVCGQNVVKAGRVKKVTRDKVELIFYQDVPFTGNVTEAFANGNLKSNISIRDGIANGLWQEWYENGKLKFNSYWLNGKGHGVWEYYHENGSLRSEEAFNLDIPVGISREYYNNGQLKMKWSWLNGKKHGWWTYYSEAGVLTRMELYANNSLVSTKQ